MTRVVTEEAVADSQGQSMIGTGEAQHCHIQPCSAKVKVALAAQRVVGCCFGHRRLLIYRSRTDPPPSQIQSIAVLPFKNESGNADVEYLSDGVTESLINSLSQLSICPSKHAIPFSLQRQSGRSANCRSGAIGASDRDRARVQRGDDLTLYLSLVDGRNGNQLWGNRYDRKLTDMVALQNEIGHDVSRKAARTVVSWR